MKSRYLVAVARQDFFDQEHPDWNDNWHELEGDVGWKSDVVIIDPVNGKELEELYLDDKDNPQEIGWYPMDKAQADKLKKQAKEAQIKELKEKLAKLEGGL